MWSFLTEEARELRSQGIRIDVTVAWRRRDYAMFPPPGKGGLSPQGDRLAYAPRFISSDEKPLSYFLLNASK